MLIHFQNCKSSYVNVIRIWMRNENSNCWRTYFCGKCGCSLVYCIQTSFMACTFCGRKIGRLHFWQFYSGSDVCVQPRQFRLFVTFLFVRMSFSVLRIPIILNSAIWEVQWDRCVRMEETSVACLVQVRKPPGSRTGRRSRWRLEGKSSLIKKIWLGTT